MTKGLVNKMLNNKKNKSKIEVLKNTELVFPVDTMVSTVHTIMDNYSPPQQQQQQQQQQGNDQELPTLITQFIQIQNNIQNLKTQLKIYNLQCKSIQHQVIQFMHVNNLQNIDTQNNIISIRNTTVKKHINLVMLSNYFHSQLNIPINKIEEFVEQVPSKTQHTLILKPK